MFSNTKIYKNGQIFIHRYIFASLTIALYLSLFIPASTLAQQAAKVAADTALNVRSGPGTEFSVVKKLAASQSVFIQQKDNGWAAISLAAQDAPLGWVSMDFLDIAIAARELPRKNIAPAGSEIQINVNSITKLSGLRAFPSSGYSVERIYLENRDDFRLHSLSTGKIIRNLTNIGNRVENPRYDFGAFTPLSGGRVAIAATLQDATDAYGYQLVEIDLNTSEQSLFTKALFSGQPSLSEANSRGLIFGHFPDGSEKTEKLIIIETERRDVRLLSFTLPRATSQRPLIAAKLVSDSIGIVALEKELIAVNLERGDIACRLTADLGFSKAELASDDRHLLALTRDGTLHSCDVESGRTKDILVVDSDKYNLSNFNDGQRPDFGSSSIIPINNRSFIFFGRALKNGQMGIQITETGGIEEKRDFQIPESWPALKGGYDASSSDERFFGSNGKIFFVKDGTPEFAGNYQAREYMLTTLGSNSAHVVNAEQILDNRRIQTRLRQWDIANGELSGALLHRNYFGWLRDVDVYENGTNYLDFRRVTSIGDATNAKPNIQFDTPACSRNVNRAWESNGERSGQTLIFATNKCVVFGLVENGTYRSHTLALAPASHDFEGARKPHITSSDTQEIVAVAAATTPYTFSTNPQPLPDFASGTIHMFDARSGRKLAVINEPGKHVTDIKLSPNGHYLGYLAGGESALSEIAVVVNTQDGSQVHRKGVSANVFKFFEVSDKGEYIITNGVKGAGLMYTNFENAVSVSFEGPELSEGMAFQIPKTEQIAVQSRRGDLEIWSSIDGTLVATFYALNEDDWIVMLPSGFFNASSAEAAAAISVARGIEAISIENVYDALYRPDLVRAALQGDPDGILKEAERDLDLDRILATGVPPQIVDIKASTTVPGDMVEVSLIMQIASGGLGRIEWRVGDTLQGVTEALNTGKSGTQTFSRKIFLLPGQNTLSVRAYNSANLIASDPATIKVQSEATEVANPRLYMIAAGVDDYLDSRLQLTYAAGDARAIAEAVSRAAEGVYESATVTVLTNSEVSRSGLDAAFAAVSQSARPQDTFIFFLAGHGITENGRYYFIPQNFRYSGKDAFAQNGIGQDAFRDWLSSIPARKSVMLYDTCESGTLTMDPATRGMEELAAIERLSRAMGRTIMTASTDTEPALEGYKGHGLFTYALLEAMEMGDANDDGALGITELISYVDTRLPIISDEAFGHRQIPQFRSQGSTYVVGVPVVTGVAENEFFPRRSTHVVVQKTDVFEARDQANSSLQTLQPGTSVRVVDTADNVVLIAKDGEKLGWVVSDALVQLN